MTPMRLGGVYLAVGLVLLIPAILPIFYTPLPASFAWLVFLWPSLCYLAMGGFYMWPGNGEGVMPLATWILGKSMYDGRLGIVQACVMSPYLVPHWLMWYFKHSCA